MDDLQRLQEKISNNRLRALEPLIDPIKFMKACQGRFLAPRAKLGKIAKVNATHKSFGDLIEIGKKSEIREDVYGVLHDQLMDLRPWRKGAFSLFGVHIDSEWQCLMIWGR